MRPTTIHRIRLIRIVRICGQILLVFTAADHQFALRGSRFAIRGSRFAVRMSRTASSEKRTAFPLTFCARRFVEVVRIWSTSSARVTEVFPRHSACTDRPHGREEFDVESFSANREPYSDRSHAGVELAAQPGHLEGRTDVEARPSGPPRANDGSDVVRSLPAGSARRHATPKRRRGNHATGP